MSIAKNGGTRLTIRMTDRDVIERVAALFPVRSIQVVVPKPARAGYSQPKTQYAWRVSDPSSVRRIIELMLPWMGHRRSAKARELLDHLASRPGIGGYQRSKERCPRGHEYTPKNTYLRPGTTHRHCRACRTEWSTAYRERQVAKRGQVISA